MVSTQTTLGEARLDLNQVRLKKLLAKLHEIKTECAHLEMNQSAFSIFNEDAGSLLFQLYYNRCHEINDKDLENKLYEFIQSAVETPEKHPSYCNGIAGFGWFLNHIIENEFIDIDERFLLELDLFVFELGEKELEENNHDFLHGGLGQIVYLVTRIEANPEVRIYLEKILDLLESNGTRLENGFVWKENKLDLERGEQEVINLNLSHGSASKIAVLAKMYQGGIKPQQTEKLIRESVDYMLSQKDPVNQLIPTRIVNGETAEYHHPGWCRGNLAMSLVIWQAGDVLNDMAYKMEATAIGLAAIKSRAFKLNDAAICHGVAGLSHMNYRMYLNTHQTEFLDEANYWLDQTLDTDRFEDGLAGYKFWNGLKQQWQNDYCLLTGLTGIGMTLLSRCGIKSNWDQAFLMS